MIGQNECTRKGELISEDQEEIVQVVVLRTNHSSMSEIPQVRPYADQTEDGDHELKMKLHIYITTVYCILGTETTMNQGG